MTDPTIPSPADDPLPSGATPPPPPPAASAPPAPPAAPTAPAAPTGDAPAASPWGPAPAPPAPDASYAPTGSAYPPAGAAYPPAAGAYPPAAPVPTGGWTGAYDQPSQPGQQPLTMSDARLWAMLSHLSGFVISIIGPLIILLTLGKKSAFVKDQSTEALNFQLTMLIASIVGIILIFVIVGILLLIAIGIYAVVFMIIASVKSYNGERYRYPINIRMIK